VFFSAKSGIWTAKLNKIGFFKCGMWPDSLFLSLSLSTDTNKLHDLEEMQGNDQEMTEEEWIQTVDKLNKHQVGTECNVGNLSKYYICDLNCFALIGNCREDESGN